MKNSISFTPLCDAHYGRLRPYFSQKYKTASDTVNPILEYKKRK